VIWWRFCLVVVVSFNHVVVLRRAWLVLGWVIACRQYETSHPDQLSLAILPWVGTVSTSKKTERRLLLDAGHAIEHKLTPATRSPEICFCTSLWPDLWPFDRTLNGSQNSRCTVPVESLVTVVSPFWFYLADRHSIMWCGWTHYSPTIVGVNKWHTMGCVLLATSPLSRSISGCLTVWLVNVHLLSTTSLLNVVI